MTEFVLIRHGETAENLSGILQGHYEGKLNELGMEQAHAAAKRLLKEAPFDAFYSSDLQRAAATAEVISKTIGMTFETRESLREWHLGDLEGRPVKELWEKYPQIMDTFKHEPPADVPVPGGESYYEFYMRVFGSLTGFSLKHKDQRVLLVTHGGFLRMVFRTVCGSVSPGVAQPLLSNTGYYKIRKNDADEWQLCVWNDISHLETGKIREQKAF